MTKRGRNIVIGLFAVGLTIYGGFWLYYYYGLEHSKQKAIYMQCDENRRADFQGIVTLVKRYEYDSYMYGRFFSFTVEPKDSSKQSISYQYNLPENEELLNFIEIGQMAIKQKDSEKFSLVNGEVTKQFVIEKCDVIERKKEKENDAK